MGISRLLPLMTRPCIEEMQKTKRKKRKLGSRCNIAFEKLGLADDSKCTVLYKEQKDQFLMASLAVVRYQFGLVCYGWTVSLYEGFTDVSII